MNKLTFKVKIFPEVFLFSLILICIFLSKTTLGQIRTNDSEKILNLIEGEWEWVSTYGGYTGRDYFTPTTEGYTLKYKFERIENINDSLEYWFFKNDSEVYHSKAKINYFNNMYGANYWYFDYLYGEMMGGNLKFGFYTTDTLYFADNGYDGYGSSYAKSTTLSTVNFHYKYYTIFPNPTRGIVFFNNNDRIDALKVMDLAGQVLIQKENLQDGYLNIEKLNNGVYLIETISGKNRKRVEKIVLKR